MTLENNIKDVISKKLEEGIVENLIAEQLENGIKNALKDLLGTYGDVTKVIEKQVKSVMIPYLEAYDYSKYITKLDSVLVEVLQSSALENKKLLTNFSKLMHEEKRKSITMTELFDAWKKHVAANVKTDGLEIDYDDEPSYAFVDISFQVEEEEGRSWSSFKHSTIFFECEHDEEMNFAIKISKYTKESRKGWDIDYKRTPDISSLRHLSEFEVFLMNLTQNYTKLILDTEGDSDEVRPDKMPEASFS